MADPCHIRTVVVAIAFVYIAGGNLLVQTEHYHTYQLQMVYIERCETGVKVDTQISDLLSVALWTKSQKTSLHISSSTTLEEPLLPERPWPPALHSLLDNTVGAWSHKLIGRLTCMVNKQ